MTASRAGAPSWTVRAARVEDRAALETLLDDCGLPRAGIWDPQTRLWVAEVEGAIVGAAGLEGYGEAALLRSVATRSDWRGRGVAHGLCREVLAAAARCGHARAFLLTETAADFFGRLGFRRVPRNAADAALLASAEFQGNTCASATLMTREIAPE